LTVATNFRRPFLTTDLASDVLRAALQATQADHSFEIDAIVILPDHWHSIWTLPPDDTDFSIRMRLVKGRFTRAFLAGGGSESGRSISRTHKDERSVWQRRFWEHSVRNDKEFERLCDYIHHNPVKHGNASCPHEWPYSSFRRFVRDGRYDEDWQCICEGRPAKTLEFKAIAEIAGE